jgi:flavin reductase (DIM6/NTAB) family NADH-FMN oxidoreductase RutF
MKKNQMEFDLSKLSSHESYSLLTNLIAPRPIALVSTIDSEGNSNLSPFSFFNIFSSNPPIVIFSPLRRIRDNTTKHTLDNVVEHPEVVINIVTKDIIGQSSLASADYEKDVDEFIKSGFTKQSARVVKPPMVFEAKAKLECRVVEIKPLGREGGAGNLVICEVVYMHICDDVFENGKLDPLKLDLVARLGGAWYCEVNATNLFRLPKPAKQQGMGMDNLSRVLKTHSHFSSNELAALAGVPEIPGRIKGFFDERVDSIETYVKGARKTELLIVYIRELLDQHNVDTAWQVLLTLEQHLCNEAKLQHENTTLNFSKP